MSAANWLTPQVRRRLQILIYIAAIVIAVALVLVGGSAVLMRTSSVLADRLAALNDVLAGSAVLLALVGAAVALQAHAVATGAPKIDATVWLGSNSENQPLLVSNRLPDGRLHVQGVTGQSTLHVRLRNAARFDATDVRLLVTLRDAVFDGAVTARSNGWRIVDVGASGAESLDWVSDCWIYADSTLRLPPVDLPSIRQRTAGVKTAIHIRVFANSFQDDFEFPLAFVDSAQSLPPI